MTIRTRIVSTGHYLPKKVVTNYDLEKTLDTSHEWILQRTGIVQRHTAETETTSEMAAAAGQEALDRAGLKATDLDLIVIGTVSGDLIFPSAGTLVQEKLGASNAYAFDVAAACSGFIYGLSIADKMLTEPGKRALIVGAETITRMLDWTDRSTCVLFGDGAGAVIVESYEGTGSFEDQGILSTHLFSDGSKKDYLKSSGGISTTGAIGHMVMDGKEVFRHAVVNLAQAVEAALVHNQIPPEKIDWLVPHQANLRIIDAMGKKLKLPAERVVVTIDRHANTSTASVPLAFHEAVSDGRIKRGDVVLMEAMGGGFAWGSALIRF